MTNVVTPFRSNLFGSRGCDIKAALDYVDELALGSLDAVSVQTAARVLLNTIEAAVAQSQGPSPEKLAIIALIDERVMENQSSIQTLIDDYLQDQIDDFISNWMSNNFDITDYNVDDAIETWMDNNMDDKIQDAISNIEFSVTVK
jgi:hypothetical protein